MMMHDFNAFKSDETYIALRKFLIHFVTCKAIIIIFAFDSFKLFKKNY